MAAAVCGADADGRGQHRPGTQEGYVEGGCQSVPGIRVPMAKPDENDEDGLETGTVYQRFAGAKLVKR